MRRHEGDEGNAAIVARQRLPFVANDVHLDRVNEAVLRERAFYVDFVDVEAKAAEKNLIRLQLTLHAGHQAEESASKGDPTGSQSA